MDSRTPTTRKAWISALIVRSIVLLAVLAVAFFIEPPPDVKPWLWKAAKIAAVILAAMKLAEAALLRTVD